MSPADDRILDFLGEYEIVSTPKVVAANIDYNRQYVNQRIWELEDHDLVEKEGSGLYRITDKGLAYLAGELDAEDLESRD